jgi:hypothetical protein
MLKTGFGHGPDGTLDFSFHDLDSWVGLPIPAAYVMLGDDDCGPLVAFTALPPGAGTDGGSGENGPAHGHASDSFRMPLLGEVKMGAWTFGPGQFRLQKGWKPYGEDTIAAGRDGGWEVLMYADRRGVRVRPVRSKPDDPIPYMEVERQFSEWTGWKGDWFGDDPNNPCPPSTLSTSLGAPGNGGVSGSFADTVNWQSVSSGTKVAVGLVGDHVAGPVVVLCETEPGARASSALCLDTEVLRIVYGGSCTIGPKRYGHGDMRVDAAGVRVEPVIAGADGLREVVIIGDRRALASLEPGDGWTAALGDLVNKLGNVHELT